MTRPLAPLRLAIADPPYFGYGSKFYGHLHPDAADCDTLDWHADLIRRLYADFDGFALFMTSGNLFDLLPLFPADDRPRVAAWVKPFASFKPGVNPAYAWEPVVFRGGRKRGRDLRTARDWCAESITMRRGLTGAKPVKVTLWCLDLLGAQPFDEIVDLFPGSGAVSAAIAQFSNAVPAQLSLTA